MKQRTTLAWYPHRMHLLRLLLITFLRPKPQSAIRIMTDAAPKNKCIPCSGMDESFLLPAAVIEERLQDSLWTYENNRLTRSFTARNFQCALDCVNAMGAIAERESHHPDFHLTNYREIQIDVWTHKLGGVTENDLVLVDLLDSEVSIDYSPKWLKANPQAQSTAKTPK